MVPHYGHQSFSGGNKGSLFGSSVTVNLVCVRGLHGLKTEARTRPVPEIVWPDPTRAAQLNLERSYPLNINPKPNPKPESISGPAGSGRVADL